MEETTTAATKADIAKHSPFGVALLRVMPWAISFHDRMLLLRQVRVCVCVFACVRVCVCAFVCV
jgi:hypothetical protein